VTGPNGVTEAFARVLPKVNERNAHFWQGGADGVLRLLRCQSCGTYLHPPSAACFSCRSLQLAAAAVSGRGVVYSHTINHYRWLPDMEPPYVVAEVELVEQEGLRLITNIVECDVEQVRIGMEVAVVFARHDDVYIPLFRPSPGP
jgi:uncharacterized protein